MKPLSETLTELGIAFKFPIEIRDANGNLTYRQTSNDWWVKWERDDNGNETYYENSDGITRGTPRPDNKSVDRSWIPNMWLNINDL